MDTDLKKNKLTNKLPQFFHVLSHVHPCYNVLVAKDEKKHFQCLSIVIYNNYSPKWRWLVLDIYRGREAARQISTILATSTSVNNGFSIY